MKKYIFSSFLLIVFVAPAFAGGNDELIQMLSDFMEQDAQRAAKIGELQILRDAYDSMAHAPAPRTAPLFPSLQPGLSPFTVGTSQNPSLVYGPNGQLYSIEPTIPDLSRGDGFGDVGTWSNPWTLIPR